ncbi:radical SAM protein [Sphingopyxis sp. QXT-31]|nr:radical SAM protein [Sphingopyxis sp. QXT-31]
MVKPTRYDDDGYPLQWWRSIIPSNSLACLTGIIEDALARGVLAGREVRIEVIDEIHSKVDAAKIARSIRRAGAGFVGLVGVQSNQFPRALDLARIFRAGGVQVAIGGFHVSGCLSMLKTMPAELVEAQAMGVSFFAGEAEEGRIDEVLVDAANGAMKPVYNWLGKTPHLEGAPLPLLPKAQVDRNINRYASFDLGRGCPFECSFCTIINVQGRKSRFRTPDDLEAIVRANAAQGVSRFFLTDDNFARNRHWEPLLDRLIALQAEGLGVRMAIQVDTLAHRIDGFIDKCVAAGADQIFIGLENINPDNLEAAKKRQNRVEEYREMFLAWKRHPVVITCGYIIGFPNDSYASVMRDIAMLKEELPVDTLYLNYLTPLPGSEDHRRLLDGGVWMDPDLNKYDLNHRVTHHPTMSDEEWERAYRDAHRSFYSWDHMERILRRMAALGSNKKRTTVNRLLAYREAVRLEGVAKLESGYVRIKRRTQRRPGLPRENLFSFWTGYAAHTFRALGGSLVTYVRLYRMMRRIVTDPSRFAYRDRAISADAGDSASPLVAETRATDHSQRRAARAKAA